MTSVTPFLMFTGRAEEAVTRYVGLLPDSRVERLERDERGAVQQGEAVLAGQRIRFFDSPPVHDFTFTPSLSLWVDVDGPDEVDRLAAALSAGGTVLMEAGAYPFAARYAWVQDEFGVSWQLSAS